MIFVLSGSSITIWFFFISFVFSLSNILNNMKNILRMQYIYTRNVWYWKKWSKLTIQFLASLSLFHFRINDLQKKIFFFFQHKAIHNNKINSIKKKNKQLYWIIEIIICMNDVNIWSRCCRLANIYPLPVWFFFFFEILSCHCDCVNSFSIQ